MGWEKVNEKLKNKYKSDFVSCDELNERSYIFQIILEEYPMLSRMMVENALEHYCRITKPPREREHFIKCVARYLGFGEISLN
ncbi:MAG: hypothetical protein NTX22_06625 [Ignavibacteriales bacterium]|nr:hypothetical protein [Ignavibacteriales bacterium]